MALHLFSWSAEHKYVLDIACLRFRKTGRKSNGDSQCDHFLTKNYKMMNMLLNSFDFESRQLEIF